MFLYKLLLAILQAIRSPALLPNRGIYVGSGAKRQRLGQ